MSEDIEKFIDEFAKSLSAGTFVKMTLGNYKGADEHLQKLLVRLIKTKKGTRLFFQYRYDTRDVVKNYDLDAGPNIVKKFLHGDFHSGHLFTTTRDLQLDIGKKASRLNFGKPTFKVKPALEHDRRKKLQIDPNSFYLRALGITNDHGEIRAQQQSKWKQINKFVEILAGLYDKSSLKDKKTLNIVDMGSGKGYLTFAAYDYFANRLRVRTGRFAPLLPEEGWPEAGVVGGDWVPKNSHPVLGGVAGFNSPPGLRRGADASSAGWSADGVVELPKVRMTGVDTKREMIDLCNSIASACGFDGLKFVYGTIKDHDLGEVDILIALHACDTATDDALFKGITANAEIIIAAPCCHKEIRPRIKPPAMFKDILKHGIMLERTAETITDGLRSLLLERSGYSTKLFEFVATEHTPKNNMLVASRNARHSNPEKVETQIAEIKSFYGIHEQRLEELLKS